MAKILVTGSEGFVGHNLIPELESRGYEVWGCDIAQRKGDNDRFVRADITKPQEMERIFSGRKFDFVYNLAATYGRWCCEDFDENAIMTNCWGARNMLHMQQRYGFRMVHFSSAEVYGDYPLLMTEDVMDRIPIKQMNEYAISKWHNELDILAFSAMHGNEVVRVRPGCMFGEWEYYHPYRGVIPVFIYKALMNEPYTCYLGHTRIHDYIKDSCRTYANIVDNFKAGEVYNIGGKPEWNHSIKQLSDFILKSVGRDDSKVIYKPEEPFTTKHKTLDSSKAIRDLGHNPSTPMEVGIPKTVEWMKSIYGRKD